MIRLALTNVCQSKYFSKTHIDVHMCMLILNHLKNKVNHTHEKKSFSNNFF